MVLRLFSLAVGVLLLTDSVAARTIEVKLEPSALVQPCSISQFSIATEGRPSVIVTVETLELSSTPVSVSLKLPEHAETLRAVADGCWSETVRLSADEARVRLSPIATLTGTLGGGHVREPEMIRGWFLDAGPSLGQDFQSTQCTVEKKRWNCEVPAQRPLHLRLEFPTFSSVYHWNIVSSAGEAQDLGEDTLVPGASISGFVRSPEGEPVAGSSITATPLGLVRANNAGDDLVKHHIKTDRRGFFQLNGLNSGAYRVVAEKEGLSRSQLDVRSLGEGEERQISLLQTAMGALQVIILPPVTPLQEPWTVSVMRHGSRPSSVEVVSRMKTEPGGEARFENLDSGSYFVVVTDGQMSEVAREQVEMRGISEEMVIAVADSAINGRITMAGEGVAAKIKFGHLSGRQVRTSSDAEGKFRVSFPIEGEWAPSVSLPDGTDELRLPRISIGPTTEDISLEIFAGRVSGRVIDSEGDGTMAGVAIRRERKIVAQRMTEEDGEFVLAGIEPGDYTIEAEAQKGTAGPLAITISDDEMKEVELRLKASTEFRGRVVGESDRVLSGAFVRLLDPLTGSYLEEIADAQGEFVARLRGDAKIIDTIIIAPPYPVSVSRVSIEHGRTAILRIASGGATVRLLFDNAPPWPFMSTAAGSRVPVHMLLAPQFGNPRRVESIPGGYAFLLSAGRYGFCETGDSPNCRFISLSPFGSETLDFRKETE